MPAPKQATGAQRGPQRRSCFSHRTYDRPRSLCTLECVSLRIRHRQTTYTPAKQAFSHSLPWTARTHSSHAKQAFRRHADLSCLLAWPEHFINTRSATCRSVRFPCESALCGRLGLLGHGLCCRIDHRQALSPPASHQIHFGPRPASAATPSLAPAASPHPPGRFLFLLPYLIAATLSPSAIVKGHRVADHLDQSRHTPCLL